MNIFDIFSNYSGNFDILSTLIAAFVAFVLCIFWYNPKIVGAHASELLEENARGFQPNILTYIVVFIFWLISSSIYTFLTDFLAPTSTVELICLSTFIWVGFVLPPCFLSGLQSGKKLTLIGLDSSYFLAGLYLFAIIHDVL